MASGGTGLLSRWLSVSTRVSLVVVAVAIAALAATAAVGLERGTQLAREAVQERLATLGATRGDQVATHLEVLGDRIGALAASPLTADAIEAFASATDELEAESATEAQVDDLTRHYVDVVEPPLAEVRGRPVGMSGLFPVTDAAVRLQTTWTAVEPGEDPALVDDADDGTTWSSVHATWHPSYRDVARQSGFTDLWLVDLDERIVYSVDKRIDLGTSLEVGPHSGGVLATAVAAVVADPLGPSVVVGDLAPTVAAGDQPMGVVASPVLDGDRLVGVVAGGFDVAALTEIMTDGADWSGLGDTGQAYLAAGDATMRSDDRLFLQDPQAWQAAVDPQGDDQRVRASEILGTTAVYQDVDEHLVDAATGNGAVVTDVQGPTGRDVIAAVRPVAVDDVDWSVVVQVDRTEFTQPLRRFTRDLLVAMALFVVLVTFLGVAWANRLTEPLRSIARRLRETRHDRPKDRPTDPVADLAAGGPRDYRELASDIDHMLVRLEHHRREVAQRAAERLDLLRQFLPTTVVKRAEAGEQDVLDQVEHATVTVLVLHGLGALVRGDGGDRARDVLDRLVDEVDEIAQRHGVDRLRLGGDSYHAVSGAIRPLLDHAPRSAAFALEVREVVGAFAADADVALGVGTGLASGPVTIGLTRGDRMVFDAWGSTVDRAGELARTAAPGVILVDESAVARLPTEFTTDDSDLGEDVRIVVAGTSASTSDRTTASTSDRTIGRRAP